MTRALVLGGGGPVGIAWETGLLHGLECGGVYVSRADAVMGTSAGSAVGAQLASGRSPAELFEHGLDGMESSSSSSAPPGDMNAMMAAFAKLLMSDGPQAEARAEIGAFALQATTISEDDFIAGFARAVEEMGNPVWPGHAYACSAADADTGDFVIWNEASKVPLARAVASSCSVPGIYPPITINGRRYVDGGIRTPTNADMAKGHDIVLVVAVTGHGTNNEAIGVIGDRMKARFEAEQQALRDGGAAVAVVQPDAEFANAFGFNLMDFTKIRSAAEMGARQGAAEAARLKEFWQ